MRRRRTKRQEMFWSGNLSLCSEKLPLEICQVAAVETQARRERESSFEEEGLLIVVHGCVITLERPNTTD